MNSKLLYRTVLFIRFYPITRCVYYRDSVNYKVNDTRDPHFPLKMDGMIDQTNASSKQIG